MTLNAGYRALAVVDSVQGVPVPVHVLYPTSSETTAATFDRHVVEVALDGEIDGEGLGVVAISHGNGGTPWSHRGLALHLARAGYAVVLVEHPGNCRLDNALAGTVANLANRPRHLRLALDAVFADPVVGPRVEAGRAALIGHSIGGYTALAVAGGRPSSLPHESLDGVARPIAVEVDHRVDTVVLLAPALPWLMAPGALAEVRPRMLVRTGECDDIAPPDFVARVLRGLPDDTPLDQRVVPGAGHFAWIHPFPPELASPAILPSLDPAGFDRAAYQAEHYADVLAFLRC